MASDLKVITLSGDGMARGRQYGEQAREMIQQAVAAMREQLASGRGLLDEGDPGRRVEPRSKPKRRYTQAQLQRFVADTQFQREIEAWTPDLLQETEGIAQGANVAWSDIFALQLMDEIWTYEAGYARMLNELSRGCTSIAVAARDGRPALLAQNLDVAGWMDGYQIILRVRNSETEIDALVYTMAGVIGANGLNSRSLGVAVNGLTQLAAARRGLPVAFIVRALLAQPSLRAARRYVGAVPHATGQHYLLASPEGIAGFECSANGVCGIENDHFIAHSNHPLVSLDRVDGTSTADELLHADSGARLEFVKEQHRNDDSWSVGRLKSVLGDRTVPLCRVPSGRVEDLTFATTIMELGAKARLTATAGPPVTAPFQVIELT